MEYWSRHTIFDKLERSGKHQTKTFNIYIQYFLGTCGGWSCMSLGLVDNYLQQLKLTSSYLENCICLRCGKVLPLLL